MAEPAIIDKLGLIKKASSDVKARIDEILERDDKIEIATMKCDEYADDLYRLMRQMAETANPVLKKMGLEQEEIDNDIAEYVKVLENNNPEMYFASINVDAKYSKNKYTLANLNIWLERLQKAIDKIEGFLETESEKKELTRLFAILDKTSLPAKTKNELKDEFLKTLNRLHGGK